MIHNTAIKVGLKIKPNPPNSKSIIKSIKKEGDLSEVCVQVGSELKKFHVDAVHDSNSTKEPMFTDLKVDKFIQKFIDGFNVTILAYGHTGAGKTYCMEGNSSENGIIVDGMKMIYENMKAGSIVSCSYIQLYNEKIFDLLAEDSLSNEQLKLRWDIDRDFLVEDLSSHQAESSKEMEKLWKKGTRNRVVASNKIHDMSSRSHALFIITLTDKDEENNARMRQLTFVDLAGSERLFDSVGRLSK